MLPLQHGRAAHHIAEVCRDVLGRQRTAPRTAPQPTPTPSLVGAA
jgi:hypothetical protein